MKITLLKLLKFMSLQCLIIVTIHVLTMQILMASKLNGQNLEKTMLSAEIKDKKLVEIFRIIEKKTDYVFAFDKSVKRKTEYFSFKFENQSLQSVLIILAAHGNLKFKAVGFTITAAQKEDIVERPLKAESMQQASVVSGVVTDENGDPLPGVNILEKGTTNGTTTDVAGRYTISVSDGAILSFSFIGYAPQEVGIDNQSVIDIKLSLDSQQLAEVVVTGYGTQMKKDITGSVAVVDMSALKSIPAGSVAEGLQGQASGVNVVNSGVPGGASNIFIRGVTSFGNTQPLILIDGVQTNLDNISSNDIESVQVLKDAGAAAIYGVRGSNGVIIVTTKKGKSGQPVISYDAYFGMQLPLPGNPYNLVNSADFANLTKIANPGTQLFANGIPDYLYRGPGVAGTAQEGDPAVDPSKYNLDPANPANNYLIQKADKNGVNWFQEGFSPAPIMSHNITASGGTDKSNYLFGIAYFDQEGTLLKTFYKRYSARINTQFSPRKNIRIGENAYIFHKQNSGIDNQSEGNAISSTYRIMPIIPVYDIAGNFGGTFAGIELGEGENVVATQERTVNDRAHAWDIVGNVFAEVDFLRHFTIRTSFGGTIDNGYNISFGFNSYNNTVGNTAPTSLNENAGYNSNYIWTNTLKYSHEFGKHNLSALAGSEAIKNYGRSVGGGVTGLYSTDFEYLLLSNGTSDVTNFSSAYENALFSYFARADYSYNDKYLIGLTVRRDGSSKFGTSKRYGVFPAVSIGWRVTGETFLKNVEWLNDLKIRGSYGVLGSQLNVSSSNAYTLFGGGFGDAYYDIGGTSNSIQQGFYQTQNGNPNTGWEENVISNVGLDASVLNNRLDVTFEYYRKSINGLLFPQPLPATAGNAQPPTINIGDIQNSGFDVSGTFRGNINQLQYSVGANVTTYKNQIIDIPGDAGFFDTGDFRLLGKFVRNQEGHAVSSFFGYEVLGLFRDSDDVTTSPLQDAAAPGRFKYRDVNGDNVITPDDRTFIGDPNPDFTYGLNTRLSYKDFDFSAIFYGSQGNDVVNITRWYTDFFGSFAGAKRDVLLNAWTPENMDTNIPKVELSSNFSTSAAVNSYYIDDGSYLRLRSLVIGYTVKPASLTRIGLQKLRIYTQATNLFTFTSYEGLDPELSVAESAAFGIDRGNYPNNQKSFLLGINLSF